MTEFPEPIHTMLFNSYIFIFLFLPVSLLGYFLLNRWNCKCAQAFLAGMSLWFYGYFNPSYLLIICSSVLFNYAVYRIFEKCGERKHLKKAFLILSLIFNLGLIFYFKYYNFFLFNMNAVFKTSFEINFILLPLGISFFTFQQVSFCIDAYYGKCKDYSFIEYALFVLYFPQLIAGPIVLHDEIIPQFRDPAKRKADSENLYQGIVLFTLGLAKKVLVADTFGAFVDLALSEDYVAVLTSAEIFWLMISYTLQLYFDFSGYSDMATGIARMFNFGLPMNFNSPYVSYSVPEFWSRWHMTLTRFFRQYVYFPLGGNRKGEKRTYLNIMAVFVLSGIWHGANWTFILWGILHGIANVLTRRFQTAYEKLHKVTQWVLTFSFVNIMWLLFRANSLHVWADLVRRFFRMEEFTVREEFIECFMPPETELFRIFAPVQYMYDLIRVFPMLVFVLFGLAVCLNCRNNYSRKIRSSIPVTVGTAALLTWCVISLSGVTRFLYFNF